MCLYFNLFLQGHMNPEGLSEAKHPQFETFELAEIVWNNHALVCLLLIMDVSSF